VTRIALNMEAASSTASCTRILRCWPHTLPQNMPRPLLPFFFHSLKRRVTFICAGNSSRSDECVLVLHKVFGLICYAHRLNVSNGEHTFSESVSISRCKSGAAPTEMTYKITGSVTAIFYS